MKLPSPHLEKKIRAGGMVNTQVVVVDIVSYSRRLPKVQVQVIRQFMRSIRASLKKTARKYNERASFEGAEIKRDTIVLPTGDGAAIAFPFDFAREMAMFFVKALLQETADLNGKLGCEVFPDRQWCNCHDGFSLRYGVSEGTLVLYEDLNELANIAGEAVNMAERVMRLADANQVFLTYDAYRQLVQLSDDMTADQFRQYQQVVVKHGIRVDAYQYIDENVIGLDTSPMKKRPVEPVSPEGEPEPEVSRSREQRDDGQTLHVGGGVVPKAKSRWFGEMPERMVEVRAGEFAMGNAGTGQFQAVIPRPFYIDKFPMTQDIYEKVLGHNHNPSHFRGPKLPVENISWLDAVRFCNKLSELSALRPAYQEVGKDVRWDRDSDGFRLPTEVEWEYCCRADCQEDRYGQIDGIAWYKGNSKGRTHEVGGLKANDFGLHDMLGNVWEWCYDWHQRSYPTGKQFDYAGPERGLQRVLRGGSWQDLPACINATYRNMSSVLTLDRVNGMRVILPSDDGRSTT